MLCNLLFKSALGFQASSKLQYTLRETAHHAARFPQALEKPGLVWFIQRSFLSSDVMSFRQAIRTDRHYLLLNFVLICGRVGFGQNLGRAPRIIADIYMPSSASFILIA